ncbi:MAG: ornithine cyclodeaminase family protein [Actinomycetes bacterium]
MSLPYLDGDTVERSVSLAEVVDALGAVFAAGPSLVPRTHVPLGGGDNLLMMPAADDTAVGVKLLMVLPGNQAAGLPAIQGCYVLSDRRSGAPLALLDGAALTRIRTPAVSALATRALARTDVERLAVFGTGVQARAHVDAMLWARPSVVRVEVVGRTRERADRLVADLRGRGYDARSADPAEGSSAGLICTCTSSAQVVVVSSAVRPGTHVNAVGSYRPDAQEVDAGLVARSRCVVDHLDAAKEEAGDLIAAVRAGPFAWSDVAGDLVGLARGLVRRQDPEEVTFFKSVGLAVEDLVVATLVARRVGLL